MKSKRIILFALISASLLNTSACTSIKNITVQESKNNFSVFRNDIENIISKSGYKMELLPQDKNVIAMPDYYRESYKIAVEGADVNIIMYNDNKTEFFTMDLQDNITDKNEKVITLAKYAVLFSEVANCISGKTLSDKEYMNFLNAPAEKYNPEKYNRHIAPENAELEYKLDALDFGENWLLTYMLTQTNNTYSEYIEFAGPTKQLKS